jgi:ferredoxin
MDGPGALFKPIGKESFSMSDSPIYRQLQKHMDKQAVGFPATLSGSDIGILKYVYSEEEAAVAMNMTYKYESAETILSRAGNGALALDDLESKLSGMIKKGGSFTRTRKGKRYYALPPLVVGLYELQRNRMSPEFINLIADYTGKSRKFAMEYLSTEKPQMRIIPIAESITPENRISTYDDVYTLLDSATGPYVLVNCICREKKAMVGEKCTVTQRYETCLALGDMAEIVLYMGIGREVDRETARQALMENQKEGLVLQPSNSKKSEFICSCCGCCCGILDIHKNLPKPLDFWSANYHAVVDTTLCNGCGTCSSRCQVAAIHVAKHDKTAKVDLDLCLGCGVCVPTCPGKALSLEKNSDEVAPPETMDDLYDIIMAQKKGTLFKLKLIGKLLVDVFKTGRYDLLMP